MKLKKNAYAKFHVVYIFCHYFPLFKFHRRLFVLCLVACPKKIDEEEFRTFETNHLHVFELSRGVLPTWAGSFYFESTPQERKRVIGLICAHVLEDVFAQRRYFVLFYQREKGTFGFFLFAPANSSPFSRLATANFAFCQLCSNFLFPVGPQ